MGAIGPTGFIFRDFLKYILPTLIAGVLFSPLFIPVGDELNVKFLILACFLLGYIIYSPISFISSITHSCLKIKGINIAPHEAEKKWCQKNYDYKTLWGYLEKDEREYLYLTQSYFEFYQTTGFYFIIYSLSNFTRLLLNLPYPNTFHNLLMIKTNLIWNFHPPTLYVLGVALILSYSLLKNATLEYSILYGRSGFYAMFSEKYHKNHGGVAVSVWGKIVPPMESDIVLYRGRTVNIFERDKEENIMSTAIDKDGYFQFINAFGKLTKNEYKLSLSLNSNTIEEKIRFDEKSFPYIELILNR